MLLRVFFVLNCFFISACSSSFFAKQLPTKAKAEPPPLVAEPVAPLVQNVEPATLVFLRSSVAASAAEAALYDVSHGEPILLGSVPNNSQLHLPLSDGVHTFMLASEKSLDYVQVEAEAGGHYVCLVKPVMGAWKPSFSFQPLTTDAHHGEGFALGDPRVVSMLANTATLELHAQDSLIPESLRQQYQQTWAEWLARSMEEKQQKIIGPGDSLH